MSFSVFSFSEAPLAFIQNEPVGQFGVNTTYASTTGYTTRPDDALPNQHFEGRIQVPLRFTRSIISSAGFGGPASAGFGELELINTDGYYDDMIEYGSVDGRRIVIKIGAAEDEFDRFGVIFDGTSAGIEATEAGMRIRLRDFNYLLSKPLQANTYNGGGGLDGTADIKGAPKPLCYGKCLNITPVLVNPSGLVYQVHDGAIQSINAVYDRGALLTAGSGYTVDLTAGTFTLLAAPAGQITADVQGAKVSGVYLSSTASIVDDILRNRSILPNERIDASSVSKCASDNGSEVGFYSAERISVDEAIGALMRGIGGWYGFNRQGKVQIAVLKAPTTTPRINIDERDIISLERLTMPEGIYPPPWKYRVAYERNWTVQASDLAGSVSTTRRAFLQEATRESVAQDETIQTRHPMSVEPPAVASFFATSTSAEAEAQRLLELYGATRAMYRVEVKTYPFQIDIGDVVALRYPRWNLRDGRSFVVVGVEDDAIDNLITITVFG